MENNSKNPFKTPEDYFLNLEKSIAKNTLEKKSFSVPKNYFEQLESTLISKIEENKQSKNNKVIPLFSKKILYSLSLAACLFFIVTLAVFLYKENTNTNKNLVVNKNENSPIVNSVQPLINKKEQTEDEGNFIENKKEEDKIQKSLTIHVKSKQNSKTTKSQIKPSYAKYNEEVNKSSGILYDLYLNTDENQNPLEEEMIIEEYEYFL